MCLNTECLISLYAAVWASLSTFVLDRIVYSRHNWLLDLIILLNQFQQSKKHFVSYAAVTQYMTWAYSLNFIMKSKPKILRGHKCSRDILKIQVFFRTLKYSGSSITCFKMMWTKMCIHKVKYSTFIKVHCAK